ncbi:MAG: histidinol dehydrogenase [Deltaproteobacteria bacterium]|nr:histidinol dehydrogenase [Deltaproteobacteria bacterium]
MSEPTELRDARATAQALRLAQPEEAAVAAAAARVLEAHARDGTAALVRFTAQFDELKLAPSELQLPRAVHAHARKIAPAALLDGVRATAERAEAFGRAQRRTLEDARHEGLRLRWLPRSKVGIYLRRAPSFDAKAFAARVGLARAAGVRELVVITPPGRTPTLPGAYGVDPAILATAEELGVTQLFLGGGAQGVAQLAAWVGAGGALVGRGGRFARAALRQLAATHAVELPDVAPRLVLADSDADRAALVALAKLPRMVIVALDAAIAEHVRISDGRVFVANRDQAVVFAQAFMPARVHLLVRDAERWLGELTEASELVVGAAESLDAPPLALFLRAQEIAQSPV